MDRDRFTSSMLLNDDEKINLIPDDKKNIKNNINTIIVEWGDTLDYIAQKYNTTVEELVTLNNIANPNLIYVGETLIIPSGKNEQEDINTSSDTIYIVQKGDTLSYIAYMYKTTISAIARMNNISNVNLIYIGQRLVIPVNTSYSYSSTNIYRIQRGDTLWSISRRFGIPIARLIRLNNIRNPNLIYAGNTLFL